MRGTADVAVVGFGPVGAVLAALLGRGGIRTVVIDKADDIYPLPRAIAFDHEIMRVLQSLGLAEAVAPHVMAYRPTEYHGLDGTVIARFASLPPPYPQGWEPSFVFTQPPFERALRSAAAALPSVEVRLSTGLKGLRSSSEAEAQRDAGRGDRVELEVTGPSGATETLRARYVVGCDGGSSLVRKLLGIRFESLEFDEPWLVVDVLATADTLARLPQTFVQYCQPARPTTYVVGPGNHRRWELMLLPGEVPEEMAREATIWQLLSRWLTPEDGRLWRAATYVFHALVAEEWRKGRVLLAGDAAHMTPPFMAQGMCQGIRDAANLAWKLKLVLSGSAGEALLDSYAVERRPHVRATTETAKGFGRIICELDPEKARARDLRMLAENGDPPTVRYRQNLIPGLGQGALWHEQGAPVGERFPQPRIATADGVRLLDDVAGSGFRLVLSRQLAVADVPDGLRRALARLGGTILVLKADGGSHRIEPASLAIVETEGVLAQWLEANGLLAALVRPDHYVFAVAKEKADLEGLGDAILERILCGPAL
jgi:3-(3-hydroxy-phenyl)propionate hydroxylase